ncbi:MAG: putative metal-binding motif-containing protein [Candidatus Woesearchaeota archaeon]
MHITSVRAVDCKITTSREECPDKCHLGVCVSERDVKDAAGCDQVETACDDSKDNDCNGVSDCADANCLSDPMCIDSDRDGFFVAGNRAESRPDCDDSNFAIKPSATEICDYEDNDCDGSVDEGLIERYFIDDDGDGFGGMLGSFEECPMSSSVYVTKGYDCDDNNESVTPLDATWCSNMSGRVGEILEIGQCNNNNVTDFDGDGQKGCKDMSDGDCNDCGNACGKDAEEQRCLAKRIQCTSLDLSVIHCP